MGPAFREASLATAERSLGEGERTKESEGPHVSRCMGFLARKARARTLLGVLAFVLGLGTVPHRWCESDGAGFFEGSARVVDPLAARVANTTERRIAPTTFATGSALFDEEWQFGTFMMAAMGFGQTAMARPEGSAARRLNVARLETCLDALLSKEARNFDRQSWKDDPLDSLHVAPGSSRDRGHVAYLGYAGLALGLHRMLVPNSRFAEVHDAMARALDRRFVAAQRGFLETYPGEIYPVDNAAGLGAIALFARATHRPLPAGFKHGMDAIRMRGVDASSGLLFQAFGLDGRPKDDARGSGTALAAYFLSFADAPTSTALYGAVRAELFRTVLGFGAVLEHSDAAARSDIDSGPVVLGFGVSATGFALGASRVHADRDAFLALYATANLFGAPFEENGERRFATGGPLGDAILFAMLTAPPVGAFS